MLLDQIQHVKGAKYFEKENEKEKRRPIENIWNIWNNKIKKQIRKLFM